MAHEARRSGELRFPAFSIGALDELLSFGEAAGIELGGIPVDPFAEADGEVADEDHFGEGACVVDEIGDGLWSFTPDGAAEFLGGAAFDTFEYFGSLASVLHERFGEKSWGRRAVGIRDEDDAFGADEDLTEFIRELEIGRDAGRADEFFVGVGISHAILSDDFDGGTAVLFRELEGDGGALRCNVFIEWGDL